MVQSLKNPSTDDYVGRYNLIANMTHQGRPVWINNGNSLFLFHSGSIGWFLGEELAFCGFSLSGLVIDLEDCSQLRNRTNVQPVYGWDYSDEKLIWPNNDILYLYDYPEFLTISSNSTAAGLYPRLMGPYKRTNDNSFTQFQNSGYRNGRPIWEHLYTNAFIYLNDYGYWSVFTNYEDNDYLLIHERSEGIELPEDNWRYFDKDSNFEDRSLKVKSGLPVYEAYMTVLSDSSEPIHPMGLYKLKEDLIVSGRPVWQDVYSSATLIFTSLNFWVITRGIGEKVAMLGRNLGSGQLYVPEDNWELYFSNNKTINVTVRGVHPQYPSEVSVQPLLASTGLQNYSGNFKMTQELKNTLPVWKHLDKELFYFNNGQNQWTIADSLENEGNNSIPVYGWDYSDSNTVWPANATLYMHEYPNLLSVIPKNDTVSISEEELKYLGLYEKDPVFSSQGYPVWSHTYSRSTITHFKYPGLKPNWSILDLNSEQNHIKLFQRECFGICEDGWIKSHGLFQNGTNSSIKVLEGRSAYPEYLYVTSNGSYAESHPHLLGIYKMVDNVEHNQRPVWMSLTFEQFIFYGVILDGEGWALGPDYTVNIATAVNGGRNYIVPSMGWQVYNATTERFDDDFFFKITGFIPEYPDKLFITNVNSKNENVQKYLGDYTKINKEKFNSRPTWKNKVNGQRVYFQDGSWFVGDTNGTQLEVFGWKFSDQNTFYPNVSRLHIVEYPEALTVFSNGTENIEDYEGYYLLNGERFNGRPSWKHETKSSYIVYNVQNFWVLQNSASNYRFMGTNSFELPCCEWIYNSLNGTTIDQRRVSIKEGKASLPDGFSLEVSKKAEDALLKNGHYNKLGVYRILRNITKNDRPVWKHIIFDYYLFFGVNINTKAWAIGDDYNNLGSFLANKQIPIIPPKTGWMYTSGSTAGFLELEGLVLKPGETKYPPDIIVNMYGNRRSKKIKGVYNQTEVTSFGRPVYENENGTIFFNDTYWLWKEIKNNSEGVEIYGWHYSDNSTMLPNTNQLFTYEYQSFLTLINNDQVREVPNEYTGIYVRQLNTSANNFPLWFNNISNAFLTYGFEGSWRILPYYSRATYVLNGPYTSADNRHILPQTGWTNISQQSYSQVTNHSLLVGMPSYPDKISIFSTEEKLLNVGLYGNYGIYKKVQGMEQNFRPVWKNVLTDRLFMFTGGGYWDLINLNGQNLVFRSIHRGYVNIPEESWSYRNGNSGQWNDDDNIKITEAPTYPPRVEIEYLNTNEYTFLNGLYFKQEELHNGIPVYKHSHLKYFLFKGEEDYWKIGSDLNSESNINVFGWDYSDNDCIWPNITKLTVKDYPDKISLVTTDLQPYEREFLGVYYKTDKQASGRPVWKQPSGALYIIYNVEYLWTIQNIQTGQIYIGEPRQGEIDLPKENFTYIHKGQGFPEISYTLKLIEGEPNYPSVLTLNSSNEELHKFLSRDFGIYQIVEGNQTEDVRFNDRPIWKNVLSNHFLFFRGKFWTVATDFGPSGTATLANDNPNLLVPLSGWMISINSELFLDESITFQVGHPAYPKTIQVESTPNEESNPDVKESIGLYQMEENKTYNDFPIWKQSSMKRLLLNHGSGWCIVKESVDNDCLSQVYGWQYYTSTTLWPLKTKLFMHEYPKVVTVSSNGEAAQERPYSLGVFIMLDGILNQGRPVWRLEGSDQFLYFNGDSHWMISEDYEQPVGYIISAEQNLETLPKTGWQYASNGEALDDPSLTLEEGIAYWAVDLIEEVMQANSGNETNTETN